MLVKLWTERMAKNPNPGYFIFPFCVCVVGRAGRGGREELVVVFAGECKQLFSYVAHCINLIHITLKFDQYIP